VRLERDVYWVPDGAPDNFERLGPDQFFMMGDNSSNSQDSRMKGPVHRSRLVGSPLLVVWPPSRIHVPK
jgi:signal peptidase I